MNKEYELFTDLIENKLNYDRFERAQKIYDDVKSFFNDILTPITVSTESYLSGYYFDGLIELGYNNYLILEMKLNGIHEIDVYKIQKLLPSINLSTKSYYLILNTYLNKEMIDDLVITNKNNNLKVKFMTYNYLINFHKYFVNSKIKNYNKNDKRKFIISLLDENDILDDVDYKKFIGEYVPKRGGIYAKSAPYYDVSFITNKIEINHKLEDIGYELFNIKEQIMDIVDSDKYEVDDINKKIDKINADLVYIKKILDL